MSLERQNGRKVCLEIGGGKRHGLANTSDTRGKDRMAGSHGEGILTSEKTARI